MTDPELTRNRPKITVIVPVYKTEAFIVRCARSLFGQSLDEIEYLFIDDCSPDGSMTRLQEVLEEFPERKAWVRCHRMERNSGLPAVRKWGIRHASGRFLIHCDSDDWIDPDLYARLYEAAVREDADIAVCDYADTDGQTVLAVHPGCSVREKEAFLRTMLLQKDSWSLCNKLVRKECYRDDLVFSVRNLGEDMVLTLQLVLNSRRFTYVPGARYYYFVNPESITHVRTDADRRACFHQNKDNADLILGLLRQREADARCPDAILYAKWCIKRQLWLTGFDEEAFRLWRSTYPEIDRHLLFSPHISFREKVKFVLTGLRLYPLKK